MRAGASTSYATSSHSHSPSAERLPVAGGRGNGAASIRRVDLVVQRRGLELGQLGRRTGGGGHGRWPNAWLPAIVVVVVAAAAAEAFVGAAPCGLCNFESAAASRLCMHYALRNGTLLERISVRRSPQRYSPCAFLEVVGIGLGSDLILIKWAKQNKKVGDEWGAQSGEQQARTRGTKEKH